MYRLNMSKCKVRIKMDGHNKALLIKYGQNNPTKPQFLTHKHRKIQYRANYQLTPASDSIPLHDDAGIKLIQGIIGALLYYRSTVDKNIRISLNSLGIQQAASTKLINAAANHILN